MKKKLVKGILILLLFVASFSIKAQANQEVIWNFENVTRAAEENVADKFPDIHRGDWYESAVQYVYDKGLMSGSNGLFNPMKESTRAQVVMTLYNMEGEPTVTDYRACQEMKDISKGQWYTNAICWAYNTGVTSGNKDTKLFNVNEPVTRQQLAAFFYRYAQHLGMDTSIRGDISEMLNADQVAEYAVTAIRWAVGEGIIRGSEIISADGSIEYDLKPTATATRAQLATMLQRFYEKADYVEDTTITVAAIETAYGSDMWIEVAEAFTARTGIAVELTTNTSLEDVIGPSMQSGEYPDVVHLATGRAAGLTEQYMKNNKLTDLTDVLSMTVPGENVLVSEKIAGGFTESSLTNPYGDGKTYLAPMFYSPCGLFYNQNLLEENGWEVPKTWDEMWELGDAALEKGIYLFTYPTTGYLDAFMYSLMYSIGGAEFFNAATNYEEGIWETEEAKTYFAIIDKLADYTNPRTPAQANDQNFTLNQQLVLDNKAIFMPNGTWIVGEMADAPRVKRFEWGMTALPAVEEGKAGYSYAWFEQSWIPSGSDNVRAAKKFIAFLYSDEACEIFAQAGAIQPVKGIASGFTGANKMFYSIYDDGAKAALGNFANYKAALGLGTIREVFFDPMNALVSGDLTMDAWIEDIISASDIMRENKIENGDFSSGGGYGSGSGSEGGFGDDFVDDFEDVPLTGEVIKVAALETAYGRSMWIEVAEAFTARTGIAVELTTNTSLEDVIGPSMQSGEYPDVIHLATGRAAGLTEKYIKNNKLMNLTDVLSMTVPGEDVLVSEKIAGGFTESSLTNPYGDGKTYLAPMFYSPCGLFYNQNLLEENGWEVPKTWDEMWGLGDAALEKGIYLFTYPTTGYLDAFMYSLMYSIGGAEFFNAATNYEEGVWETDEAKTYFAIIDKLADYTNPRTPAQANDQDFTRNQQLVLDNKAIFMPNGTWIVGEMADAPRADGFEWGMTALPAVEEGKAGYSYAWFEQSWIPSEAENIEQAKKFISFLYSDVACKIFAQAGAIQPVKGIASGFTGVNKMFYSIYDDGAKAALGNFANYKAVSGLGSIREVFFDPMNSLVSKDLTMDAWIENIISASDVMRKNLK